MAYSCKWQWSESLPYIFQISKNIHNHCLSNLDLGPSPIKISQLQLFCEKSTSQSNTWWPEWLLQHLKNGNKQQYSALTLLQLGFPHAFIACLDSHGLDAMMLALVFPCKTSRAAGQKWFHFFLPKAASHAARPG